MIICSNLLQRQVELATMAKTGSTKENITLASKNTGVNRHVQNHLIGLKPLVQDPFGMFGPDVLHSMGLGWAPKMNNILDALSHSEMQTTDHVKNIADARDRVDARLVRMPPYVGLLRFNSGWWEADNLCGTSAAENLSLLWQLVFVFVEDRLLIPDKRLRQRILALHWSVGLLARELKTPQWYRACDIESLRQRLHHMASEFRFFMLYMGNDYVPGDGMDIPKFHDLMSAAYSIVRFGCLMNGDTGVFERMMKHIKRHDVLVGRSRANDGSVRVFTTASAAEFDSVVVATNDVEDDMDDEDFGIDVRGVYRGAHIDILTGSHYGLGKMVLVDNGITWRLQIANLAAGERGPAVDPTTTRQLRGLMDQRRFVSFALQCKYTLRDPYAGEHTVRILKPGHCVQLMDSDSVLFAQILAINVQQSGAGISVDGPLLLVSRFTCTGDHDELPVPRLVRGDIEFIPLSKIHRRAHVVPIYRGGPLDSPCEAFPASFLVNTSMFPRYVAPCSTRIFMSCLCGGRLPKPLRYGAQVTCPNCMNQTQWL